MSEFKEFTNFNDYVSFNEEFIESNPFLYYHLKNTIKRVFNGSVVLYKFFNIVNDNNLISVLLIENECLIYANQINDAMINMLTEKLEFYKFKRYQFLGTKQVMDALFTANKVQFSEQKHRKFYECKSVAKKFAYAKGEMRMGDMDNCQELIKFSKEFINHFYAGEVVNENVEETIYNGIVKGNIYQWNLNSTIFGMAQAMHEEYDHPVIGHVFTPEEYRGQNIASSIVHRLTKGLLDVGHEKCMLMTNAYNPASNKAFIKVGYQEIGEYVVRYKEK